MQNLKTILQSKLKEAKRIAILGIGSDLKGDDAAGVLVAKKINEEIKSSNVLAINCGASPENFTGVVNKFNPTHIIIIDSADLKEHPGFMRIIDLSEINGVSFSTHRLPTKIMIDYLVKCLNCEAIILGIQPKSLKFGESVSAEVKEACLKLSEIICGIIGANNNW